MPRFDPSNTSANLAGRDGVPVLVVVVNNPLDIVRACNEGWYRIPLARLPRQVAAEYLAFYQTGAFPPDERWCIRRLASVRTYRIVTRRELIPNEPGHPRADNLYYKIALGPVQDLPHPIPSRRLRRITFIATTLGRLNEAEEVNDLWVKSTPQERLWQAIRQAGVAVERQYPLSAAPDEDEAEDGWPADFAVLDDKGGGTALVVIDEPRPEGGVGEPHYAAYAPAGWRLLFATCAELTAEPARWLGRLIDTPAN